MLPLSLSLSLPMSLPMSLSLKARALALLAQREQSRAELRRKLLSTLQRDARRQPSGASHDDAQVPDKAHAGDDIPAPSFAAQVDELLDWLEAHRYLSPERFIESRVHARSSRFGNLRIRQELKQHGLSLPGEAAQALAATELERARSVCARRFTAPAETAAEQARRARFLIGRGFSAEVVRRLLRELASEQVG